jgi:arylsulfatase A-like enzyme
VNTSDPRDIYHLNALYDSNLNDVDSSLGNLFNYLNSSGLLNNTVIILTSDHGEEFGEHGFLHEQLYDVDLHVPLLIYVPGAKPKIIYDQVGGIDVMPTVLSILGIQKPASIDGQNLQFLMKNPDATDTNQTLFLEFTNQNAVRTPQWKLIQRTNGTISYEFYNLIRDSGETQNLDGKNLTQEKYFIDILNQWEKGANSSMIFVKTNSTFIGYP